MQLLVQVASGRTVCKEHWDSVLSKWGCTGIYQANIFTASFFFSETNADLKKTYCSACNSSWLQIQLGDDCVVLSHFGCARRVATPWPVAHPGPLSTGFSRQEYWSGLPCSPSGALPHPGIKPTSFLSPALAGGFFTTSTTQGTPLGDGS